MTPNQLQPGECLGKYEVQAHLATGGMGSVYKAVDRQLGRPVALKVLANTVAETDAARERFRREARNAARLCHPNIVTLFECGQDAETGLHFLALEYVDGLNLHDYIVRNGPLHPEETRLILLQLVKALDHAYSQGIVHRDIKPSNILLARNHEKLTVKLTDMGLARRQEDAEFRVTREGSTVGTIDYMPPEQARDSACADIRSDIYSLGCTAYQMLAGKAPFAQGGIGERVFKHMNVLPPDVRQFSPTVSPEFWAILSRMLAKNPAERYATPRDLFSDLRSTPSESAVAEPKETRLECDGGHTIEEIAEVQTTPTTTDPATAPEPKPCRRHRESPSASTTDSAPTAETLITTEQARTAAAYHERAVKVLLEGRGEEYARTLIGNCLKLDPFNITYRKTLRAMNHGRGGTILGRWFSSLNVLALKSKIRLACTAGDWRKVIDLGEDVLACQPTDVATHIDMATAAEKLGLPKLALWFLEQGRLQTKDHIEVLRASARMHESLREWKKAVGFWQRVRALDESDFEAGRKINDLSAKDLLANGHYCW